MRGFLFILMVISFSIISCKTYKLSTHEFPDPVDTSDRPIQLQERQVYEISGEAIFADNMFEGARLNGFKKTGPNEFDAIILPENTPINPSPHYAFRLWSNNIDTIDLTLSYPGYRHRYYPKLGFDGKNWMPIDSSLITFTDSTATLHLVISPQKLYVVAQELMTSSHTAAWCADKATHADVKHNVIGKSEMGRDFHFIEISKGDISKKPAICLMSRQHPPEVSGYMAMEAFVEYLLEDTPLANDFREKFRVLLYPMMNPDGVDEGHWRHNSGGIDPNRDWGYYRQGETKLMAEHLTNSLNEGKNKLLLGFDFHSTQRDVYYTLPPQLPSQIFPFKDYWIQSLDETFPDYTPRDSPNGLESPITKTWFYLQYGAEGITYEVGDHTDRDFIKAKARAAAREMIKLLILSQ